jgi:type I restriction enzyme S subunit
MNAIQQLITEHMAIWTAADTEKKSGRGRASGNAGSVYGIKKLRELILELAVRGKLVPQDANDEPASELLKRIQAEKAKLVAEGKIKKDKPLAAIGEDEKPFELPQGWEWARFSDAYFFQEGPGIRNWQFRLEGIKLLNVQNIVGSTLVLENTDKFIDEKEYIAKYQHFTVEEGDLLFASSGASWGKSAFFNNVPFKVIVNTSTIRLKPHSDYCSRFYLKVFLDSKRFKSQLEEQLVGMQPNFGSTHLLKVITPFPPANEQHRIVAKVDELMALCDQLEASHSNAVEAHERLVNHLLGTLTQSQSADDFSASWQRIAAHFDTLFTTEASIDALKQTLLQLAVMGKLVTQDANDEPASELLKRIQAEKAKLVAEGKIKKDKPLAPISEDEKPFELPNGWLLTRLDDIGNTFIGLTYSPKDIANEGIPVLRSSNVQNGKIDLDDLVRVNKEIKENLFVENGDLLICARNGSKALVGKTAMIKNLSEPMVFGAFMAIYKSQLNEYIELFLNSPLFRKFLDGVETTTINQITQNNLKTTLLPLPPRAEQQRIVAKVDKLMALCDQLKTRIQQANQQQQTIANVLVAQVLN